MRPLSILGSLIAIAVLISLPSIDCSDSRATQILDCTDSSKLSPKECIGRKETSETEPCLNSNGRKSTDLDQFNNQSTIICKPSDRDIHNIIEVFINYPSHDLDQIELGTNLSIECGFNASLFRSQGLNLKFRLKWLRSVGESPQLNQSIFDWGSSLTTDDSIKHIWTVQEDGSIILRLNDFQASDVGNYYCQAVSSNHNTTNNDESVNVISEASIRLSMKQDELSKINQYDTQYDDPPSKYSQENMSKFLPSLKVLPEYSEVSLGQTIQLICVTIEQDPDPEPENIKWSFEYSERSQLHLKSPVRYNLPGNVSQIGNILIIWSMSEKHIGLYRCSLELAEFQTKVEAVGELTLRTSADSAPLVFTSPEVVRASLNESIMVVCKATGYPPPKIIWYRVVGSNSVQLDDTKFVSKSEKYDGQSLDTRIENIPNQDTYAYCEFNDCQDVKNFLKQKNVQVTAVTRMRIISAQIHHQGQYVCQALNKHGSNQASTIIDLEFREPPIIRIDPLKDQTIILDPNLNDSKNVTFKCRIDSGKPLPKLSWLRTSNSHNRNLERYLTDELNALDIYDLSKVSRAGSNISTVSESSDSLTLTISSISIEDEGYYICMAQNEWGKKSALARLTIIKPASVRIIQKSPVLVKVNESFVLDCITDGHPIPLDIEWSRSDKGAFFSLISRLSDIYGNKEKATLKFDSVTLDDAGEYICNARDSVNPSIILHDTIMVTVENLTKDIESISNGGSDKQSNSLLPKLMVRPTKINAKVGMNVTLDCLSVSGLQPTIVEWIGPPDLMRDLNSGNITALNVKPYYRSAYNSDIISSVQQDRLLQIGSKLKITNISKAYEGIYQCKGRNKMGIENAPALIKVQSESETSELSSPYIFGLDNQPIKSKVARVGSNIELKCQVNGVDQPVTSWSRDGMELPYSAVQIEHNLWIQNVSIRDSGLYICSTKSKQPNKVIQAKIELLVRASLMDKKVLDLDAKIVASKNRMNIGDSITLECIVTRKNQTKNNYEDIGNSISEADSDLIEEIEQNVIWVNLHSGQSFFQDNVYIQNNLLIIYNLRHENSATYRCSFNDLTQHTDYKLQVSYDNDSKLTKLAHTTSKDFTSNIAQLNTTNGNLVDMIQVPIGQYLKLECPFRESNYHWSTTDELDKRLFESNKPLIFPSINTNNASIYNCHSSLGIVRSYIVQVLVPVAKFLQKPVSFITLPSISGADQQLEIELKFLPENDNGLILFNGQQQQQRTDNRTIINSGVDYISLGLNDGYLEFRFELGDGATLLRSIQALTLNQWHKVVVERNRRGAVMYIDKQPPVSNSSTGKFFNLNLDSVLYVGGHQFFMFNKTATNRMVRNFYGYSGGFQGCMSYLKIANREINLVAHNRSVSVGVYECDKLECSSDMVDCHKTNSICQVDRNWWTDQSTSKKPTSMNNLDATIRASGVRDYRCICLPGFSGNTCDKETPVGSLQSNIPDLPHSLAKAPASAPISRANGACDVINTCSQQGTLSCQSLTSTSFKCHCSMGYMGETCGLNANFSNTETSMGFNSQSYLQLRFHDQIENSKNMTDSASLINNINSLNIAQTNIINPPNQTTKSISMSDELNMTFYLQTKSSYGIIFYTGLVSSSGSANNQADKILNYPSHQASKSMIANMLSKLSPTIHDYLSIALVDGHLELNYELGSGVAIVRSSQRVNDGQVHQIKVTRVGKWSKLVVDGRLKYEGTSPGKLSALNIEQPDIYLGGLPDLNDFSAGDYLSKFIGCLSKIEINNLGPLNLIKSDHLSAIKGSRNLVPCDKLSELQAIEPKMTSAASLNLQKNSRNTTSEHKLYQSPPSDNDDPDEM